MGTTMILTVRTSRENEGKPGFVSLEASYLERIGDTKTGLAFLKVSNRDTRNDQTASETGCFLTAFECELLAENLLKAALIMKQEEAR